MMHSDFSPHKTNEDAEIVSAFGEGQNGLPTFVDPLIGTMLGGHLNILSRLGEGGMSVVYKAEDVVLHRKVAVKVLHPNAALNQKNFLRFRQEAMAASKIDHPNVIRVYEFAVPDGGQPYMVMDFIEGQSLAEFVQLNGPIEMDRAISVIGTICDGLAKAHEAGVLHRDLKPGNIMQFKEPSGKTTIKIVDFGIAKVLTENVQGHDLTQTGEVFGSPLYMSPEQCYGRVLDRRSDLYSLGCVMYELCTGQPPIKGNSLLETIQLQTSEMPKPAATIYPGIKYGAGFDRLIAKALAKDPAERFQDAHEFKAAVEALRGVSSETTADSNKVSTRTMQIAGAALGLIAIACSALFLSKNFSTHSTHSAMSDNTASAQSANQIAMQQARNQFQEEVLTPQTARAQIEQSLAQNPEALTITEKDSNRFKVLMTELASNPNIHRIRELNIVDSRVNAADIALLAPKLHLNKLSFSKADLKGDIYKFIQSQRDSLIDLNVENTNVDDEFFNQIKPLPKLRSLWANSTGITNKGVRYISTFPSLTALSLNHNDLNDESFDIISKTRITTLRIKSVDARASQIDKLANLKNLTYLALADNTLDADAMRSLSHVTSLRTLGLESTGVSDADVSKLVTLQDLRFINLSNCPINGTFLNSLAKISTLQSVMYSENPPFPGALIEHFKKANPDCFVGRQGTKRPSKPATP